MTIPSVGQRALIAAMSQFDKHFRHRREWANWHQKRNHKYAIVSDGNVYPVKKIISLATGISVMDFHGGEGTGNANEYARERHLDVQEIANLKLNKGQRRRRA